MMTVGKRRLHHKFHRQPSFTSPLRVKLLRIRPVLWVVMEEIEWDMYCCPLWDSDSIDLCSLQTFPPLSTSNKEGPPYKRYK